MIDQKDVQFFDDNGYLFLDEFIEKHIIEDISKNLVELKQEFTYNLTC